MRVQLKKNMTTPAASNQSWNAWRRGVFYTRVAVQNVATLTFDVLDGQGCSGKGASAAPSQTVSLETVLNREALGDYVSCPVCGGIFPANAPHEHDEIDDIVNHRTSEYRSTSIENVSCMFGCSCCICTVMLSWIPYCVLSCLNTSKRRAKQEEDSKTL